MRKISRRLCIQQSVANAKGCGCSATAEIERYKFEFVSKNLVPGTAALLRPAVAGVLSSLGQHGVKSSSTITPLFNVRPPTRRRLV